MSFSSSVKNELAKIDSLKKCCLESQFSGVVRTSSINKLGKLQKNGITIITESAAFARNVFSTIKKIYGFSPNISIRISRKFKKTTLYILTMSLVEVGNKLEDMGIVLTSYNKKQFKYTIYAKKILNNICCKKSYLRGAFLANGSVSNPEKTYHLEIATNSLRVALEISYIMKTFGLRSRVIKRKNYYVTYLKEGDNIVDFLNIVGAHNALMKLENVRILKDMRNNVNRIVNCETANLEKTIIASVRQVENIKYIKDKIGFDNLPENLREIAEIRIKNSDANLKELGEMLEPKLGKSGVNHRLRKLDAIADNIRKSKGDI